MRHPHEDGSQPRRAKTCWLNSFWKYARINTSPVPELSEQSGIDRLGKIQLLYSALDLMIDHWSISARSFSGSKFETDRIPCDFSKLDLHGL